MTELYQVGAITQTHGIRGEVKVFPMTDDVSRFKNMKELIFRYRKRTDCVRSDKCKTAKKSGHSKI